MSCTIEYNGNKYLLEDFVEYLKSQIPIKNEINVYAGTNENKELSNFAIRPFTINVETPTGEKQFTFQSVEQGFHFYKTMVVNRPEIAKKILSTTNGATLKSLTNRSNLPMTPEQVEEWDAQSKSVMLDLMYESFLQNPEAAKKLLDTGSATLTHKVKGVEQDNGRFSEVLMRVRDMLRENGSNTQSQSNTPSEFTNHSGGAYGGDTLWDIVGRRFGVTNHRHYKEGKGKVSQTLAKRGVGVTPLDAEQMKFAKEQIDKLLGPEYLEHWTEQKEKDLQIRNFYQVHMADSVFAIAKLTKDGTGVRGGTNTAVQLGIKLGKPVYVWDIASEQWYLFDGKTFVGTETPTLTKDFAGIGSRDIEKYPYPLEKDSKGNVTKWGTNADTGKYVGDIKAEKAKQAVTEVYEKTFKGNKLKDEGSLKELLERPYKGFENVLWYWFSEKARRFAPEKYDSIVNAKDYHTAYLIGSKIPNTAASDLLYNEIIKEVQESKGSGNTNTSAETVYSELGDKTQSENVVLPKDLGVKYEGHHKSNMWTVVVPTFKRQHPDGIVAYRGKVESSAIGNPFSVTNRGANTVVQFIDWIITGNNQGLESVLMGGVKYDLDTLRDKYLDIIKNGKGKKILYYKDLGRPSHATALDYLINKYDWNKNENKELGNTNTNSKKGGVGYYEGDIKPEPNTVFVFGSNPRGVHGAGAALVAKTQFGAVQGIGFGLQGNSFAIPTKDLAKAKALGQYSPAQIKKFAEEQLIPYYKEHPFTDVLNNPFERSISPTEIIESIKGLYEEARKNPDKQFKVAFGEGPFGYTLNGYLHGELMELFNEAGTAPSNVVFSKQWVDSGVLNTIEPTEHFNFKDSVSLLESVVNHPDVQPYLKELAQQLLDNADIKSIPLSTSDPEMAQLGRYNSDRHDVTLPLNNLRKTTFSQIADTIVHEYIHAATVRGMQLHEEGLEKNVHMGNILALFQDYHDSVKNDPEFTEFKTLFERYVKTNFLTAEEMKRARKLKAKYYPALNAKEFITMGLTSKKTKKIFEERNILQKLFDSIKEFLGLDNNVYKLLEKEYGAYLESTKIGDPKPPVPPTPPKPPVSTNTPSQFTYKGVTIPTQFQLGEQQEEALRRIIDFIEKGDPTKPFFTLQGFAGTGKTTVIGYVQKYFKAKAGRNKAFRYIAPTHAATAQLAVTTAVLGNEMLPATVRSGFYSQLNKETGKTRYGVAKKLKLEDFDIPVFIVDETSLMAEEELQTLLKASKSVGGTVIFMGDNKQIPEVAAKEEEEDSGSSPTVKNMNSAFQTEDTIILDKVYRQSTSDLLDTLTEIRDRNHFEPTLSLKNNDGSLQELEVAEYNESIIKDFEEDLENTVYIAYTNDAVSAFNKSMKQVLTGEIEPLVGDKIVGYVGHSTKQIEKGQMANSISYVIRSIDRVSPNQTIFDITAYSSLLANLERLGVDKVKGEARTKYVQLSPTDSFQFNGVTQEQMDATNRAISAPIIELYNEYMKVLALPSTRAKWIKVAELEFYISEEFAKYDFGDNYTLDLNKKMLVQTKSLIGKKLTYEQKKHLSTKKGIDFGYGVTAHKSQGMTVDNVYVDLENINRSAKQTPILVKGVQINTEKNALYYVAMSRARKKVVVRKMAEYEEGGKKQDQKKQAAPPTLPPSQGVQELSPKAADEIIKKMTQYGFVDILAKYRKDKFVLLGLTKFILKDLGHDISTNLKLKQALDSYKVDGNKFLVGDYLIVEDLEGGKLRIRYDMSKTLQDEVEDGPVSLGGISFTSSDQEFDSKNIFKEDLSKAFNCK